MVVRFDAMQLQLREEVSDLVEQLQNKGQFDPFWLSVIKTNLLNLNQMQSNRFTI